MRHDILRGSWESELTRFGSLSVETAALRLTSISTSLHPFRTSRMCRSVQIVFTVTTMKTSYTLQGTAPQDCV